jgi:predicted aminopeptidase
LAFNKQFPEKQRQILAAYNELIKKRMQGDLSDHEFAGKLQSEVESEVVVPWRELTAEWTGVMKDRLDPGRQEKFEQYMLLRQKSFEDLLASVREDDDERVTRSMEEAEAASKIADEMNKQDEKEK